MPCSVVLIDRAFNGESKHVVRIARGAEFNLQIAGAVVHKEPFVVQLQRFVAAEFNILQAKICAVLRAAHCISLMSLFAAGLNRPLGPYNFTGHIGFKMQCAARNVESLVKRRSRFRRRARDCCAFRCGGRHSDCGGEQHHKSQNRSRESFDTFHFCSSFSFFCA